MIYLNTGVNDMNVGTLSIEEFKKVAGENGVENVTDEEYVDHAQDKPWSLKTALTRVRKGRDGMCPVCGGVLVMRAGWYVCLVPPGCGWQSKDYDDVEADE